MLHGMLRSHTTCVIYIDRRIFHIQNTELGHENPRISGLRKDSFHHSDIGYSIRIPSNIIIFINNSASSLCHKCPQHLRILIKPLSTS